MTIEKKGVGVRYPTVGIIAFVPDRWGGVWQLRHQILTRLSHYFPVVWVDPATGWRSFFNYPFRQSTFWNPHVESFSNFTILRNNRWLPKVFRPRLVGNMLDVVRTNWAEKYLRQRGATRIVTYLWRPQLFESEQNIQANVRVYHIDDEYSFKDDDGPVTDLEKEIIDTVDHVFIHSPAMMEKKGKINPNTTYAPNGVDFHAFAITKSCPIDLAEIVKPRVGYIGVIQSTIDWALVCDIVLKRPNINFVFVGPEGNLDSVDKQYLRKIRELANSHFLGAKPVDVLPNYAQHMDICIMPYKQNGYTKYIFPLKVNEYLAAGKPTIGTPIRSLREFSDVIDLADTGDEWVAAIDRNFSEIQADAGMIKRRQETAMEYDWDIIVSRIARTIQSALAEIDE